MTFTEPVPFGQAVEALRAAGLLPTNLSSEDLRALDAGLRERSVFSARTTNASYLQEVKDRVEALLEGKTNVATARAELQDALDALQYTPQGGFPGDEGQGIPPAEAGDLRDLSSDRRINLLLDTNVRQRANRGFQLAGQSDFALYAWPCYELVRIAPRRVPRGEKIVKGKTVDDPENDWPSRWEKAGGEFYGGRMIARKDDDIWARLGDSGEFPDALDTDVPPFAFNSGYGWREVEREECVALGVIDEDTDIQGRTPEREAAAEVAADFDPEFLKQVQADLKVSVANGRAKLEASKTLSAPAQALGPVSAFTGGKR